MQSDLNLCYMCSVWWLPSESGTIVQEMILTGLLDHRRIETRFLSGLSLFCCGIVRVGSTGDAWVQGRSAQTEAGHTYSSHILSSGARVVWTTSSIPHPRTEPTISSQLAGEPGLSITRPATHSPANLVDSSRISPSVRHSNGSGTSEQRMRRKPAEKKDQGTAAVSRPAPRSPPSSRSQNGRRRASDSGLPGGEHMEGQVTSRQITSQVKRNLGKTFDTMGVSRTGRLPANAGGKKKVSPASGATASKS